MGNSNSSENCDDNNNDHFQENTTCTSSEIVAPVNEWTRLFEELGPIRYHRESDLPQKSVLFRMVSLDPRQCMNCITFMMPFVCRREVEVSMNGKTFIHVVEVVFPCINQIRQMIQDYMGDGETFHRCCKDHRCITDGCLKMRVEDKCLCQCHHKLKFDLAQAQKK
jgi:hypothetical protein